jgi:hypothetical protein
VGGMEMKEEGIETRMYEGKIKTHPVFPHIRYIE